MALFPVINPLGNGFVVMRGNGRQPKERWTYVFTNADYDAAEAMVPFE